MTADALGVPVVTGPAEATAIGNVAVQMITEGELADLEAAREVVARSFESETFQPCETETYDAVEQRFEALLVT